MSEHPDGVRQEVVTCDVCGTSVMDHKWAKLRATSQPGGWMMKKSGEAWCPDHLPAWVEPWRAKRHPQRPPQRPAQTSQRSWAHRQDRYAVLSETAPPPADEPLSAEDEERALAGARPPYVPAHDRSLGDY